MPPLHWLFTHHLGPFAFCISCAHTAYVAWTSLLNKRRSTYMIHTLKKVERPKSASLRVAPGVLSDSSRFSG